MNLKRKIIEIFQYNIENVPTSCEAQPSDFNNIVWQRMRKQWLETVRKPLANDWRCANVIFGVLLRPMPQR